MRYCCTILLAACTAIQTAYSQVPDFSKVPNLHENDSAGITQLINNGVIITAAKVICWFPKDSLSYKQMKTISDTINKGVIAAEKFIHAPLSWQAHRTDEPYTFYFRTDSFFSHASCAGFVSVPFRRIKSGKAPWLHEAVHEMLYTNTGSWFADSITEEEADKEMPSWLFEGLADYISTTVSKQENLAWFDIFSGSSRMNIDSMFKEDLKGDKAAYIISFIGKRGFIPELSGENRRLYAPCFYHGSCSFVKYLVDKYSFVVLLNAVAAFKKEQEYIEASAHKSIDALKTEWMQSLKAKE